MAFLHWCTSWQHPPTAAVVTMLLLSLVLSPLGSFRAAAYTGPECSDDHLCFPPLCSDDISDGGAAQCACPDGSTMAPGGMNCMASDTDKVATDEVPVAADDSLLAGHGRRLAQTAAQDLLTAFLNLVQDYCYANTGARCDEIDYTGTSSWYKSYWPTKAALSNISSQTGLVISRTSGVPITFQASTHSCQYTTSNDGTCAASNQFLASSSNTVSKSNGISANAKVGTVVKAKGPLGTSDLTMEFTVDFGFSFSASTATASIIGQSMTASVQVPLKASDKHCYEVIVSLARTQMVGKYDAYIELRGGFGTRQNSQHTWANHNGGVGAHWYMWHPVSAMINDLKAKNIPRAAIWTAVSGGARTTLSIEVPLDVPLYAYANPKQYNLTSPKCNPVVMTPQPTNRSVAIDEPDNLAPTSTTTTTTTSPMNPNDFTVYTVMQNPNPSNYSNRRLLQQQQHLALPAAGVAAVAQQQHPHPHHHHHHHSHNRRGLQDQPVLTLQQSLDRLLQAYCKYESGYGCTEVDWNGTTSWWRTNFLSKRPTQAEYGMDKPVLDKNITLFNMTPGIMVCPYRPFAYTCRTDNQLFTSTVQTRTMTIGVSAGFSVKVTALWGIDLSAWGLAGGQIGATASVSTSYNFQTSEANANTLTTTNAVSYSVTLDPANNPKRNCSYIMTNMSWVMLTGTQNAWISITGMLGVYQTKAVSWKDWTWDTSPAKYRVTNFATVIRNSLNAGLPEAKGWSIVDGVAKLLIPIQITIRTGAQGASKVVQYAESSPQCKVQGPA